MISRRRTTRIIPSLFGIAATAGGLIAGAGCGSKTESGAPATVAAGTMERQQEQSRTTSLRRSPSNESVGSNRSNLCLNLKGDEGEGGASPQTVNTSSMGMPAPDRALTAPPGNADELRGGLTKTNPKHPIGCSTQPRGKPRRGRVGCVRVWMASCQV